MIKRILKKGVTNPQKYKCSASFVWYSAEQADPRQGEVAYSDETGWEDRAANWSSLLATAKGDSKGIEEEKMDKILGRNRKTVCQDLEDKCKQDLTLFEIDLIKRTIATKRPRLQIKSYKIRQCEVQLSDAGAYNSHMRDIHGVRTEV